MTSDSGDTASQASVSTASSSAVARRSTSISTPTRLGTRSSIKRTPTPSRLNRPFKSPLARAAASSSSSASPRRTEREELEERLRVLRQADKILRDGSLEKIPNLTAKWRQAGRLAAQDLWTATGAAEMGADASTFSVNAPYRDDEEGRPAKRIRTGSSPPVLKPLPRPSRLKPGSEPETYEDEDPQNSSDGYDSPVDIVLPKRVEESGTKRPLKHYGGTSMSQKAPYESSDDEETIEEEKGIEDKWNIGKMLDLIGVNKKSLRWNGEEEDFEDD